MRTAQSSASGAPSDSCLRGSDQGSSALWKPKRKQSAKTREKCMPKHKPFSSPPFAVLFYREDGRRARSSGLATYGEIEATRKQVQSAMRMIPDAFYAELHPYIDGQHYQTKSVETVYRE